MINFGSFPPEIHSARLYSGPGASSMLGAASAWSGLAGELNSAATDYETVVTRLNSEEWMGPASAAMAASITPYTVWMRTAAAQAEETASKARSAAAAFEAALAAIVPPPQIAGNRAQLSSLIATNVLGQNAAAIAANEAQYGEMWAQNAATMFGYAGSSSAAASVTPYSAPPQTTNLAAATQQAGAVAHAAATSAGAAQSTLSQMVSSLPAALQSLTSPLHSVATTAADTLQEFLNFYGPFGNFFYDTMGLPFFGAGITSFFTGTAAAFGLINTAPLAAAAAAPAAAMAVGAHSAEGVIGGAGVSATLANAGSIGKLSVPPMWAGANPIAHTPLASSRFVSEVIEPESAGHGGSVLGGMPLAGSAKGATGTGPRYGVRLTVMAQPPSAG